MAKKKKKGRQRPSIPFTRPAFTVCAAVRVKSDVLDPDFPDVSLGGWAGQVAEINRTTRPPMVRVTWDQATLAAQPTNYRERCEQEDLDPETIWLESDDLELESASAPVSPSKAGAASAERLPREVESGSAPVSPPAPQPASTETPLRIAAEDIQVLPPKAPDTPPAAEAPATPAGRIQALFGAPADALLPEVNNANLRRYLRHLNDRLTFPLAAIYYEDWPKTDEPQPVILVRLMPPPKDEPNDALYAAAIGNDQDPLALPLHHLYLGAGEAGSLLDDYRHWLNSGPYRDAEGELIVPRSGGRPRGPRGAVSALLLVAICTAGAGAVVGAALTVLEWGRTFEAVAAALLGVLGCLVGGHYEHMMRLTNRKPPGMMFGGFFGAVAGAALGALVGALLGTFVGSLLGAMIGSLLGRLLRWARAPYFDEVNLGALGACAGALVYLFIENGDLARGGAFYGALIGGLAGPTFLVCVVLGIFFLIGEHIG